MNSNLDINNATFAQRQEYTSSLKEYRILADFDGLLVAIDKNHPVNLYVSDLPNGRRTDLKWFGQFIWIHLDQGCMMSVHRGMNTS